MITSESGNFQWDSRSVASGGNSGNVCQGIDLKTNANVAIKKLKSSSEADREASFLRELSSPFIVQLLAQDKFLISSNRKPAIKKKSRPIVVTPWYNGRTLSEMIHSNPEFSNGLPDHLFLSLLQCLSSALSALRSVGIHHRDISHHNVMLHTEPTGESRWILVDFGQAIRSEDDGKEEEFVGTAEFLPLQLFEKRVLKRLNGFRSTDDDLNLDLVDLWMIGVTLFLAATGRYPYQPFEYREYGRELQECHEIWANMMRSKEVDSLWIQQEALGGDYQQHDELPEHTALSNHLKIRVEELLGILQPIQCFTNDSLMTNIDFMEEFQKRAKLILDSSVVDVMQLGRSWSKNSFYLQNLDWSSVRQVCGEEQLKTEAPRLQDRDLVFLNGHLLSPDTPLSVPLQAAAQLASSSAPVPILTIVNLQDLLRDMPQSDSSTRHMPELPLEKEEASAEEMELCVETVRWFLHHIPDPSEMLALRDTFTALLRLVSQEVRNVLQRGKCFQQEVEIMLKLCTQPVHDKWAKLLHFQVTFSATCATYQEILFEGDNGGKFAAMQLPGPWTPIPWKTRLLSLFTDSVKLLQPYMNKSGAPLPADSMSVQSLPVNIALCRRNMVEAQSIFEAANVEMSRVRNHFLRSAKKFVSVLESVQQLDAARVQYKSVMEETLDMVKDSPPGRDDCLPRLSGSLFSVVQKGTSFVDEVKKMEAKLSEWTGNGSSQ